MLQRKKQKTHNKSVASLSHLGELNRFQVNWLLLFFFGEGQMLAAGNILGLLASIPMRTKYANIQYHIFFSHLGDKLSEKHHK